MWFESWEWETESFKKQLIYEEWEKHFFFYIWNNIRQIKINKVVYNIW